jgi:hypothetical protein
MEHLPRTGQKRNPQPNPLKTKVTTTQISMGHGRRTFFKSMIEHFARLGLYLGRNRQRGIEE